MDEDRVQGWGGMCFVSWGLLGLPSFLEEPSHPSFSIFQRNKDLLALGVLRGGSSAERGQRGEVHVRVWQGKAILFLNRKALPSQYRDRKFLLESGGLESEKL